MGYEYTISKSGEDSNIITVIVQPRELEHTVDRFIDTEGNSIKEFTKIWKSKYNNYVQYDCEPFFAESFDVIYTINFLSKNSTGYFSYLLEKELKNINVLERALLLSGESS